MQFTGKRYNDYGSFIKLNFGERVQKISLDIGFSCPNRDGTKGFGGCTYCNNNTFTQQGGNLDCIGIYSNLNNIDVKILDNKLDLGYDYFVENIPLYITNREW